MISALEAVAILIASCWDALLKLKKLPLRWRGDAALTIAIAGINRPDTKIIKNVDAVRASQSGTGGRLVLIKIGKIDINATMINILTFPCLSHNFPIIREVKIAAKPPKKYIRGRSVSSRPTLKTM